MTANCVQRYDWNLESLLYLQAMFRDCRGAPSCHHKASSASSLSVPNTAVANRARGPAHGTRNGDNLPRPFAACPEKRHAKPCCGTGSPKRLTFEPLEDQLLPLECTTGGAIVGGNAKAMQARQVSIDIALPTQLHSCSAPCVTSLAGDC